jgi:hypothetical protein
MTGETTVTALTELLPIKGADRIAKCKILGETIIVSKDYQEGELGLLMDTESVLSEEFCRENNLFRHESLNKDTTVKGMFDDNPRIRPIRLRGVKVSGFWIPVKSLSYAGDYTQLKEGDKFNEFNGRPVVQKYIPKTKEKGSSNQPKAIKVNYVPTFKEHTKTDHLLKSLNDIPEGNFVITAKLHGCSGRVGNLLARKPSVLEQLDNKAKNPNRTWLRRLLKNELFRMLTAALMPSDKEMEYRHVVGSRTVVKSVEGLFENPNQGFYENDIWTQSAKEVFFGNLEKGFTVYYEIIGFDGEKPIMPNDSVKSLEKFLDKEEYKKIKERFGDTISYHYGVGPRDYDVYVYRVTMTNEDGEAVDLSWEQVKRWCEKKGVKHVPEICTGVVKGEGRDKTFTMNMDPVPGNDLSEIFEYIAANAYHNNTYPEGFCLRVEGYPNCKIWKHKHFGFKALAGAQKDAGVVDMEESQEEGQTSSN